MHPDTDEFLHVLEGSVSVELYGADGNEILGASLHSDDPSGEATAG